MKRPYEVCLDPQPFREWCLERIDPGAPSDELGGYARHFGPDDLARKLGLDPRRLYAWRFENKHLDRLDLEEALERGGYWLSEVYPEFTPDAPGYCPSCKEDVPANTERCCIWCQGKVWKRRSGVEPGIQSILTDQQVRALYGMHEAGAAVVELARRVWVAAGYASPVTAEKGIRAGFRRLGLPILTGSIARHRRCAGVNGSGRRKGERCSKHTMLGSDHCLAHAPERRDEVRERMHNALLAQKAKAA